MTKSESLKESIPSQNGEIDLEMRPGGMLVQKRENGVEDDVVTSPLGPKIKINVSQGSTLHEVFTSAPSTFGDVKKLLSEKTGLEPNEQRLLFRGQVKEDAEQLQIAGVKDKSKMMLLEDPASRERKLEETRKNNEISKQCEAVAGVRAEVDRLSERVAALESAVCGGTKVAEKEFDVCTELLMKELLKLDGIKAEGEAKLQRKSEVRRVQSLVDTLDTLKVRNSNPFNKDSNAVSVTTKWETFDSGVGSLSAPPPQPQPQPQPPTSSSTEVTQDWEQFE